MRSAKASYHAYLPVPTDEPAFDFDLKGTRFDE